MMLINKTTGEVLAHHVRLCDTFGRRLRGLMFRRTLDPDEVYLFRWGRPSRTEATIHSLFVFFSFAVLWLDAEQKLVDCRLVRPFALVVAPKAAASCFIEGVPELLDKVRVGDRIVDQRVDERA
jgi:uncharacterized membrane protein (UPF0127 family)